MVISDGVSDDDLTSRVVGVTSPSNEVTRSSTLVVVARRCAVSQYYVQLGLAPDARDRSRDQRRRRSCVHADITAVNINRAAAPVASVFPSSPAAAAALASRHDGGGGARLTDGGGINATRRTQSVIRKLIDYLFAADLHPVRVTLLQCCCCCNCAAVSWPSPSVLFDYCLTYELTDNASICICSVDFK